MIETTAYIDPQDVGGYHLVYLPKYTVPGSPYQEMSDKEIEEVWLENLEAMLPQFDRSWVQHFLVHREPYVEPMHPLNSAHLIPAVKTPIGNLYLLTTAQIYPQLTNDESVCRYAQATAQLLSGSKLVPARRTTVYGRATAARSAVEAPLS